MKPCAPLALLFFSVSAVAAEPADVQSFRQHVQPFFKAHCVKCHGAQKPEAEFVITSLGGDLTQGKSLDRWIAVSEKLKAGEMPPDDERQPEPAAIQAVTDWIDRELAKAGLNGAIRAGSLKTGNHVPHGLLFGPAAGKVDLDNPPRIWRISPFIYEEIAKQFKNVKLAQPYSTPPGEGFKDQAKGGHLDESTTAQLMRNAEAIADEQLGLSGRKFGNKKPHDRLAPLLTDAAKPDQVAIAVGYQFAFALKRKPTADEVKRFTKLYFTALQAGDAPSAARVMLVAVLLQPENSYRSEAGAGEGELRMLTPRELAFAIAYAITDKAPDATLLAVADKGELKTAADVRKQVTRLLDDSSLDKPRILRFFREYFGYTAAPDVFKDQKDFPGHDAKALVEDTDQLVRHILAQDQDVFRQLLTTNLSFVSYRKSDDALRKLHDEIRKYEQLKATNPAKAATKEPPSLPKKLTVAAYNQRTFVPAAQQPIELPAEERAGILTQPAWLVAYSENAGNHAIRRGKWVRERLLGGTVPDVPITVDAQLPDAPHKTLRERMEVTKVAYCWQCHQKMNPIGLTFEQFDHFGRFRTVETVEVEGATPDAKSKAVPTRDLPVDSTGRIDGTGDPAVDGSYESAVQMIRQLAKTDRARQVFVRHAFRYWMGREENLGDARTLMEADAAYVKSGGSMKALVTSLLTGESFLMRTSN